MTDGASIGGDEMADPLAVVILRNEYDNTTHLLSVNGVGTDFAHSPVEVKSRALSATRWLLGHGLITLFPVDMTRPPSEHEIPWQGTVDEQVGRLDEVYAGGVADWHKWGNACWFANTEAGDALAENYPLPDVTRAGRREDGKSGGPAIDMRFPGGGGPRRVHSPKGWSK
jgi:hypothetical protein